MSPELIEAVVHLANGEVPPEEAEWPLRIKSVEAAGVRLEGTDGFKLVLTPSLIAFILAEYIDVAYYHHMHNRQ